MDTHVVKEQDGKKYNQFGQQIIPCSICGEGTTMLGTKHCDRCHELDSRIRHDLDIAERLVKHYRAADKNSGTDKIVGSSDVLDADVAKRAFYRGEKPCFSTGICGSLTCGYGKLDEHGYWQFPLHPAEDYLASNAALSGWPGKYETEMKK